MLKKTQDSSFLAAHHEDPSYTGQDVKQNAKNDGKYQMPASCHYFHGSTVKTSSPAHWHKDIEIIHFISGTGFVHTSQCKSVSFDAPAIVVVPANLIHRTGYGPDCVVSRMLFKGESLRLHEADIAVEKFLRYIRRNENRGSLIIRSGDFGFDRLESVLRQIEALTPDTGSDTYYPSEAQEVSIKQDKVDDYVAATFANTGSSADAENFDPFAVTGDEADAYAGMGRMMGSQVPMRRRGAGSNSINAGSIAIARAQPFSARGSDLEHRNDAFRDADDELLSELTGDGIDNPKYTIFDAGSNLQFKALLLYFVGVLIEYDYCLETQPARKPRATRYNDEKIKTLLKYIHDNYNRALSIGELAAIMQVTNQYFCRYFKQLTDMSFIDYINDLRLQRAARDIAATDQSIREISSRHGFDTIGYFFKLFRERYNTTPIGYRNMLRNMPMNDDAEEHELVRMQNGM